jgi:hypothetical protein
LSELLQCRRLLGTIDCLGQPETADHNFVPILQTSRHFQVWDNVMTNETFKNRAIEILLDIALDAEILAWMVSTLTNITRNFA